MNISDLKALATSRRHDGESIWVSGYFQPNDGGGGVFVYDADSAEAENGGTVISPLIGGGRYIRAFSGPVDVKWFGAVGDGSSDDTDPIQRAIDCGCGIIVNRGTYKVTSTISIDSDSSGMEITDGATILSTIEDDTLFDVSADDFTISGHGRIECPAVWDGTNATPTYAVINASGNGFVCSGISIYNVNKVGIWVRSSYNGRISNCNIDGGYPAISWTGVETGHFGILWDPPSSGSGLVVSNNAISNCVQGFFVGDYVDAGDGMGLVVNGNTFTGCHNHGVYLFAGQGQVISSNAFFGCSLPIAALGKRVSITGNTIVTSGTGDNLDLCGISLREAEECVVSGNVITGDAPAGAVIVDFANYAETEVNRNVCSGNVIRVRGGSSSAIRLGRSNQTTGGAGNVIIGNTIECTGVSSVGIIQSATVSGTIKDTVIRDNSIEIKSASHGIDLANHDGAVVSGNIITVSYDAGSGYTLAFIRQSNCARSYIHGNVCVCRASWGANITLRGIWEDAGSAGSLVVGNRFDVDTTKLVSFTPYVVLSPQANLGNAPGYGSHVEFGKYATEPASGTWERGSVVFNSFAAASGKVGWVCVSGGSPGTWKPFGVIDS